RHTRSKRDWSSDVCSSDLPAAEPWCWSHTTSQSRHAANDSYMSVMVASFQILQILQELPDESYNNGKPSVPVTPVCDPPGLVAAGGSLCRSVYLGTERGRWDTFLFHTQ